MKFMTRDVFVILSDTGMSHDEIQERADARLREYRNYLQSALPNWHPSVRDFIDHGFDPHDSLLSCIEVIWPQSLVRLHTTRGTIEILGAESFSSDVILDEMEEGTVWLYEEFVRVNDAEPSCAGTFGMNVLCEDGEISCVGHELRVAAR